jgi:hypothetical protein
MQCSVCSLRLCCTACSACGSRQRMGTSKRAGQLFLQQQRC